VSWPKGRRLGTDLSLAKVIEIGYSHGLVESTSLRIDEIWAGLKSRTPKEGQDLQKPIRDAARDRVTAHLSMGVSSFSARTLPSGSLRKAELTGPKSSTSPSRTPS